ncbi:phage holin family protein [Paenibacillus sp. JQZ6Y-1]
MGSNVNEYVKMAAIIGSVVANYFFGGWSVLINLLLVLVVIDWLTGWAAAWMAGELKSRVGYRGIARKVAIFGVVAVAHFIDLVLGGTGYFQDAVIFFYLANELLSVVENAGRMGLPMPAILLNAVRIFQSKAEPVENPSLIPEAQPVAVQEKMKQEEEDAEQKTG